MRSHDGDVRGGMGQCPGDRQLGKADVALPCQPLEPFDHRQVAAKGLAGEVGAVAAQSPRSKVVDSVILPESKQWAVGPYSSTPMACSAVRAFRARLHALVDAVADLLRAAPQAVEDKLYDVERRRIRLNESSHRLVGS